MDRAGGVEDIRRLSAGGDYVGSIAKTTGNPSAKHQWSWRLATPDSVERSPPLAGHADDELAVRKAAEEAYSRARRESG